MRQISFGNKQVASSETARDINRSVVLNLIRRRQPISRADLARVSGLQRSTVSLITEQLLQENWVVYGPSSRLSRGRPPAFLWLNDRRAILVADIHPAHLTVGLADVNGRFLSQERIPTSADPQTTAEDLATAFCRLMEAHPNLVFEGAGISLPGRFDQTTQRLIFAPNMNWPEFDFKTFLERRIFMPVELENAANACVLAEVWFGRAEEIHHVAVVTVSEGIGAGILANGQLARGAKWMAGEFGHVSLDPNGPPCSCGGRGCWEVYASNRAALRYYHEASGSTDDLSFQSLLELANAGSVLALNALDKMAHAIGRGMRMIVTGLAPEEIVVVGEFTSLWHRLGPAIEAEVAAAALVGEPPRVRPAAEPAMARLRGAAALVLQKYFGSSARNPQEEMAIEPMRQAG
jgi:predicted NBD/HSP70 family sugar kinase